MWNYMGTNMTFFHGFGMTLFWVIILVVIFLLLKNNQKEKEEKPLDILKRRLAKGEITKEEYDKLKKELS